MRVYWRYTEFLFLQTKCEEIFKNIICDKTKVFCENLKHVFMHITKFTKWCMASSPPSTPPKMYFLSTVQIFDRFRTKIKLNWLLQNISLTLNKQTVLYFRANFFFEISTVYTLITSWIVLRLKLSLKSVHYELSWFPKPLEAESKNFACLPSFQIRTIPIQLNPSL